VGYRKELKSQIKIQASPGRVWEILSDFKSYSEWNPFITYVLGEARVGTRLNMRIRPAGSRTWEFRPKVLVSDSPRELRWLGSLWIRGLFDGEHVFNIHSLSENCVWFVQSEQFSGILVPLIPRHFWDQSLEGFRLMNEALKTRTEVWAERQSKII
jgi:hypothetical protein